MSDPTVTPRAAFAADRARYPRNAWLTERSLWALACFRVGQAVRNRPSPLSPPLKALHGVLTLLVEILSNVEIGAGAQIGPGLRIHHGNVVINSGSVIGAQCTLGIGNVLGNRADLRCPQLGDRVQLGAGAMVLGGITVGDDAVVGAMSLVIGDVPAGATVAGVPARIIA